ncbi:MAG: hypothetical protein GY757_53230 [bacterium]|nr:hypothetical protein [bacterium]
MKQKKWYIFLSFSLILTSLVIYSLQLIIFKNPKDTFFYIFQDLAFVPISVLLVTLVIDNLLRKREKQALLNKMNMVVGIFFSEMGNRLLALLTHIDRNANELGNRFESEEEWTDDFLRSEAKHIRDYCTNLVPDKENLQELKQFLLTNRDCLMRMLENPNLLEHEMFTELLWAVSHLTEELIYRNDPAKLSEEDFSHLANDIQRAYVQLLNEWIAYVKHLKNDYPYIFKLAVKNHPFK